MKSRDGASPRSHLERLFTAIVALAIGAAGVAFLLAAFQPSESSDSAEATAPDIVNVSCQGGGVTIADPEVRVQADGLHVSLDADFDSPVLTVFYGGGGRAAHGLGESVGRSDSFVLPIPPGSVTLECGKDEKEGPSEDGVRLTLTDPGAVWHEYRLACGDDFTEFTDHPFFYTQDNPFPQAMAGTLPGVRPGDLIGYAGYQSSQFGTSYRIERDGTVIGRFDLSTYDQRTFVMYGVFCRSSGIGDVGSSVEGMTSTPFSLPGYAKCDPYGGSCSSLYLSARWYGEHTGDSLTPVPSAPWSACSAEIPDGCLPDSRDMVVRIVTTEDDAGRFVKEFDCGLTEQTACV